MPKRATYVSNTKKVDSRKSSKNTKPKPPPTAVGHWVAGVFTHDSQETVDRRKKLSKSPLVSRPGFRGYQGLAKALAEAPGTQAPAQNQNPAAGSTAPPRAPQPVGNPEVRNMANDYVKQAGITKMLPTQGYAPLNPDLGHRVADEYDRGVHSPNDPETARAYAAFAHETKAQYAHALASGMKFTPWGKNSDPYKTSEDMKQDVLNNKHLGFYQGGDMPSDHPLAQIDPDHGLNYNDMFRAVHDLYGHAKEGYEFGPRGEYNAFLAHQQMYSPVAQRAMRTETHGQNSWVNYGQHLRGPDGTVPKKGQPGWIHPQERPFADQKAFIMPNWVEG